MNDREESSRCLLVARGDTTEVFDFEEEALDEIAFAIECVIAADLRRGFPGRDDGNRILRFDRVTKCFGIIAFVAKHVLGWELSDKRLGLCMVTRLTRRQNKA